MLAQPSSSKLLTLLVSLATYAALTTSAATLSVGPKGRYSKPCDAFNAAKEGDTIEIDAAGEYVGDVCVIQPGNLYIRGVNGRPKINAGGKYAEYKGIWVMRRGNVIVENIEMFGAKVPDLNGAAIRFEGVNLTLRWVYFHDNENGILTGNKGGEILIEYSEFDRNGSRDGSAHNIYVNREKRLTARYNYFHRGLYQGNVLKSRAAENHLYFNRFQSEDADTSWELDISNGGSVILIGNVFQQGPQAENFHMVTYMAEGEVAGYTNFLFAAYNTFVNQGPKGDANGPALFFFLPKAGNYSGLVMNNIFAGPGELAVPEALKRVKFTNNLTGADPLFLDAPGRDFRIAEDSPAAGKALPLPEPFASWSYPLWQIQPAACAQRRPQAARPALGAFGAGAAGFTPGEPCYIIPEDLSAKVELTSPSVVQGGQQVARVNLDAPAPPGGAQVALTYSHPNLVQGPSLVTIPAGLSSAVIEIRTMAPDNPTVATITASYRDRLGDTFLIFAIPKPPPLRRVILNPAAISGGTTASGNVIELGSQTGIKGALVTLRSSRPDLVTVPPTVAVPSSSALANFTLAARAVTARTEVVITASLEGVDRSATLVLEPVGLGALISSGHTLGAPARHMLALNLTGPAPQGGLTVQLSTDHPELLSLPQSVIVAAGKISETVPIELFAAANPVQVEVRAMAGGRTVSTGFLADVFRIESLLLNPAKIPGGLTSSAHRVNLNSPAPAGQGITIALSSSDPAVARMAASVTVQPGFSGANFTITTGAVQAEAQVTLKAVAALPSSSPSERTAVLTVTP